MSSKSCCDFDSRYDYKSEDNIENLKSYIQQLLDVNRINMLHIDELQNKLHSLSGDYEKLCIKYGKSKKVTIDAIKYARSLLRLYTPAQTKDLFRRQGSGTMKESLYIDGKGVLHTVIGFDDESTGENDLIKTIYSQLSFETNNIIGDIEIIGSPVGQTNFVLNAAINQKSYLNAELISIIFPKINQLRNIDPNDQFNFMIGTNSGITQRGIFILKGDITTYLYFVKCDFPIEVGRNIDKYYCILSYYPYLELFDFILNKYINYFLQRFRSNIKIYINREDFLTYVIPSFYRYSSKINKSSCQEMEKLLHLTLSDISSIPTLSLLHHSFPISYPNSWSEYIRDQYGLFLIKSLSLENFLTLMEHCVLESSIYIISRNTERLTFSIFSISSYLYPIEFSGHLFSWINHDDSDRIDPPGFYIIGMSDIVDKDTLPGKVVVDLDTNKVNYNTDHFGNIKFPYHGDIIIKLNKYYGNIKNGFDIAENLRQFNQIFIQYMLCFTQSVVLYNNLNNKYELPSTGMDSSLGFISCHWYDYYDSVSGTQAIINSKFFEEAKSFLESKTLTTPPLFDYNTN